MSAPVIESHVDEQGNTIETTDGVITKITNLRGKEYAARNVSFKASAEQFKALEDFRWANQLTVSEVLEEALTKFLADQA